MYSANRLHGNADQTIESRAATQVRDLALRGVLAERAASAAPDERAWLSAGAYDVVWPLVFRRLTRTVELKRGHPRCAASVRQLEPDCSDRFQDDVAAVHHDLLRNAKVKIVNLDGWIVARLTAATVDAHRRRRGERGALQRPRLPARLAAALHGDPWLTVLAVEILVWVGVPVTAGSGVWPLRAWTDHRATVTGDYHSTEAQVSADVTTVLAAMRQNPTWYANFVERPLARKQAPVASAPRDSSDAARETQHLALTAPDEADDTRLMGLASTAVAAIEARIGRGYEPRDAIVDVLGIVFGTGTAAEGMDRAPDIGPTHEERAMAMLGDPATVERITALFLTDFEG